MNCINYVKFFFIHGFSTAWSIIMDTVIMYCTIIDRVCYRSRYDVTAQVLNNITTSSIIQKTITKFYVVCFLFKLLRVHASGTWNNTFLAVIGRVSRLNVLMINSNRISYAFNYMVRKIAFSVVPSTCASNCPLIKDFAFVESMLEASE